MAGTSDDRHVPARPRIRDVAAAAGVSVTTASDALRGRGRVGAGTRARVLETAAALGYRANVHARMLRHGRSGVLGIMSSLAADASTNLSGIEYFVDILTGATTTALSRGYAVMLLPPSIDGEAERAIPVDGALLLDPVSGSATMEQLERDGIPAVSTGRPPDVPAQDATWVDNDLSVEATAALDLLWDRGARSVALITNPPIRSYAIDTLAAYDGWAAERGMAPRVVETDALASESSAFLAAAPLFKGRRSGWPDAIFAPLDRLAVGAMLSAHSAGLSVPGDLLVASGVDSQTTRLATPAITAVELHARDIGQRALELLIDRVENRQAGHRQVIVPATIHERASTRRPGTRRRQRRDRA